MSYTGTFTIIINEILRLLEPIVEAINREPIPEGLLAFAYESGIDIDQLLPHESDLQQIGQSIEEICVFLRTVTVDQSIPIERLPEVIQKIGDSLGLIDSLEDIVEGAGRKVIARLIDRYLNVYHRGWYSFLQLVGAIQMSIEEGQKVARFDQAYISKLLVAPENIPKDVYGWGEEDFNGFCLLNRMQSVMWNCGVPAYFKSPDEEEALSLEADLECDYPQPQLRIPLVSLNENGSTVRFGVSILPIPESDEGGSGIAISPFGLVSETQSIPLGEQWQFVASASVDSLVPFGVIVRPDGIRVSVLSDAVVPTSFSIITAIEWLQEPISKALLFGKPNGPRVEIGTIGTQSKFSYDSKTEFSVGFPMRSSRIVLVIPEEFGFLKTFFPSDGIEVDFDLTVGWSSSKGIYFDGGAELEVTLPVHASILGILNVDIIHLLVRAGTEGIPLIADANASVQIGPISASVEQIGIKAGLWFPTEGSGRQPDPLSITVPLPSGFSISIGFKPPTGLGLAIDAGPIGGGGFISFDVDKGRYAGILYLELPSISVTAIGLLDTKDESGAPLPLPGFSFLIIISAKFPPIQLSYGFVLTGLGGLAGIYRTIVTQALQDGVRQGAVEHIMFPDDPIRDAPQIISSLRSIFPVAAGRFVFGPMVILGWGTPPLIEAEIGVIIELPLPIRIVLLGQININLPIKDAPVAAFHLDVAGIVDFEREMISIDATLRNSQITTFPISGDMAMRLCWGDPPLFAIALGGLHPAFQPPPQFPKLKRLGIALGTGDNPRLNVEAYLAITANTVQFGASIDLYVEAGDAVRIQGNLSLDTLMVMNPFSFTVTLCGNFTVFYGEEKRTVNFKGMLKGPRRWHITGEIKVSLLFDLTIPIDESFGEEAPPVSLPARNPWVDLEPAISHPNSWSAPLPAGSPPVVAVSMQEVDQEPENGNNEDRLFVDPAGSPQFTQKVVPINCHIEKYGESPLEGADRYTIANVVIGESSAAWSPVADYFAPAQFRMMSDDEKLSCPSFEKMEAGFVAELPVEIGNAVEAELEYETLIIDGRFEKRKVGKYRPSEENQIAMGRQGAAARSPLKSFGKRKFAPKPDFDPPVILSDELFIVASVVDLSVRVDISPPTNKNNALQELKRHLKHHPEEKGNLQVVRLSDLEEAA